MCTGCCDVQAATVHVLTDSGNSGAKGGHARDAQLKVVKEVEDFCGPLSAELTRFKLDEVNMEDFWMCLVPTQFASLTL